MTAGRAIGGTRHAGPGKARVARGLTHVTSDRVEPGNLSKPGILDMPRLTTAGLDLGHPSVCRAFSCKPHGANTGTNLFRLSTVESAEVVAGLRSGVERHLYVIRHYAWATASSGDSEVGVGGVGVGAGSGGVAGWGVGPGVSNGRRADW